MKSVTCDELKEKIKKNDQFILLDVRHTFEFTNGGHIDGAINVPLHTLPLKYQEIAPDKDAEIITCCASGGRSAMAVQFLEEQGYTNVKDLTGGYMAYCGGVLPGTSV